MGGEGAPDTLAQGTVVSYQFCKPSSKDSIIIISIIFMIGFFFPGALSTVIATMLPPGRSKYHGKLINREKMVVTWHDIKKRHDSYHMSSQL